MKSFSNKERQENEEEPNLLLETSAAAVWNHQADKNEGLCSGYAGGYSKSWGGVQGFLGISSSQSVNNIEFFDD